MKIESLLPISFYDYSQVVYVNMYTPVIIGCPIHGSFKQTPEKHRLGSGCSYCSGKIFNPKTKEEIKKYWLENKITSGSWPKHWKENNLKEQGYPCDPAGFFKMSCGKWSEYVWGEKKTKEETKSYWIKHKIFGGKRWYKHCKDNNLQEQGYPGEPWRSYKMSCSEWTEYVWGKKEKKTKEEIKEYWLENKITSGNVWRKHWKKNNLQMQGYPCSPWNFFKMTTGDWVVYVWGKKEKKPKEEVKEYWLENKITNCKMWLKHWKNNNLREQGYLCTPWETFKMSKGKWIEYVWREKKTKEEIKEYWLENKITSGKMWLQHWKVNNLQEQGYPCKPCGSFKMTDGEWSWYICGKTEKKPEKKTKEEVKEYWIKHEIKNSPAWKKHWEVNNLHEQGYRYATWESFKMTKKQWTDYVWGKK